VERKQYLEAVYDVIAGTDEAAVVLEDALVRLEEPPGLTRPLN